MQFHWVIHVLGCRVAGEQPYNNKKEIPGISFDLLYHESVPTYDEIEKLLMQALETKNEKIITELFDAFKKKKMHQELTEHYFASKYGKETS